MVWVHDAASLFSCLFIWPPLKDVCPLLYLLTTSFPIHWSIIQTMLSPCCPLSLHLLTHACWHLMAWLTIVGSIWHHILYATSWSMLFVVIRYGAFLNMIESSVLLEVIGYGTVFESKLVNLARKQFTTQSEVKHHFIFFFNRKKYRYIFLPKIECIRS